eukprot:6140772-Prymnesium_polylepis.1
MRKATRNACGHAVPSVLLHNATQVVQMLAQTRPCSSGWRASQILLKPWAPTSRACSSRGAMSVHSSEHSTAASLTGCPELSRAVVLQKVNVTCGVAWRSCCFASSLSLLLDKLRE